MDYVLVAWLYFRNWTAYWMSAYMAVFWTGDVTILLDVFTLLECSHMPERHFIVGHVYYDRYSYALMFVFNVRIL